MRVLIIDVDADVRRRLFVKLLRRDVVSDRATCAKQALEKLDERSYGFVLLDVGLPDDGAATVLRRVAQIPAKERPIIVATTTMVENARSLDVELVQIVLRRPLDVTHVAELIHSCVQQPQTNALSADAPRALLPHAGER